MGPENRDILLKYDKLVPRYTSYPTAPHFQPGFGGADYARWLADLPESAKLSLYLHVPFCPKLCWFCGCHTKITRRYAPVEEYAGLLKREIEMTAAAIGPGKRIVSHVHFGGGSPSMLAPADFGALCDALRACFDIAPHAEIAVEIDPRQSGEAKIATYAKHGVNRASFGVQDFDAEVLAAVNRQQPFHCTYEAVKTCRDYGIDGINMDFMYGLPHQTVDTMRRAMDYAAGMAPDRIALFGYAHVPWMKKHMRLIPEQALPDAPARLDLFAAAAETLEAAGYVRVGIDHFARPEDSLARALREGSLRRNFQGYTDDGADALLGFGSSAIGRLPQGYVQNTIHNPQYKDRIAADDFAVEKCRPLTAEDRLRAAIIERLMCLMEADIPALLEETGFPPDFLDRELDSLAPMTQDGLVRIDGEKRISVLDAHAARPACAAFDSYLGAAAEAAPRRHARAM